MKNYFDGTGTYEKLGKKLDALIPLAGRDDWKGCIEITEPLMDKAILLASEEQGLS